MFMLSKNERKIWRKLHDLRIKTELEFAEACFGPSLQFYVLLYRSFAAVGVDPAVMGIGPAAAIPVAVKSAGLELGDIDLFEINEVVRC